MNHAPYSLVEAERVCKEYQDLVGKTYDSVEGSATIDCVAVAPFDYNNRNRFIIYYLLFEDANVALQQDYHGLLFDVLVIAGTRDGDEVQHQSLHTWLENNHILRCNSAEVNALRPTAIHAGA